MSEKPLIVFDPLGELEKIAKEIEKMRREEQDESDH